MEMKLFLHLMILWSLDKKVLDLNLYLRHYISANYVLHTLPDRLMVGLRFLVPSIGVRIPVGQQQQKEPAFAGSFCCHRCREFCSNGRKTARSEEGLSRGREYLIFHEQSEIKYLVTRDSNPCRAAT